ncbi:MAG: phosphatidate cytidylyltransferase, partial [Armatimonadota bacterium]
MQLLLKLLARAAVGVGLLGVLFGSAWLGGWWWLAFVSILAVIAMNEYYTSLRVKQIRPDRYLGWLCAILILLATQLGEDIRLMAGPDSHATPYGTL